ncbi:glycoside hydrolase family 31 protein [Sphingomonas sp. LT1P40]|uniref:glycoside hydrolase family 31 protein n=1 Tax=Alteristakelama amylovorans TaxID=3096166 RepID=UPI002FCC91D9
MKLLLTTLSVVALAMPAAAQMRALDNGVEVTRGEVSVRVTALTPKTLRVRLVRDGKWPEDASWAVEADIRAKAVMVLSRPDGFATDAVSVSVDPVTLAVTVRDKAGKIIVTDAAAPAMSADGSFGLTKAMPVGERYFGLGDKTGPFDRRGASYVHWNTDTFGYGRETDPTYKSIPFYVATGGTGGSYGLFLDNTTRSWFDFGHRSDGALAIGAPGGAADYYLITGPSTADVVRRYHELTGKAPLIAPWGLGFQQSRYSYMSDAEVRELAARLRKERIPTDVIWLDIDFQDRNRPFTTNAKTFPDLPRLARDLKADGIGLVAITDLHIAHAPGESYAPYDSGVAGDHFLKTGDGKTYVAPVWPGPSVFPDFTRAASRDWWGGLYKGLVTAGIAGHWNDMNEPAIFETPSKTMPLDNIHRIDGDGFAPRTATHAEVHNVYGMQNSRATFEGLRKLDPTARPFVMTRASYAGGQRYAVTWTGDNNATWDHLKLSVQQLVNLGLSGFSYSAADIGGFTGGPSPDLLTRWTQIGAFTPVMRVHAAVNTPRSEPWVDGPEHLALRRKAIEERYRLFPYLYAVAEQQARTGDPIVRPIFYDYAASGCDSPMAFTLGRDVMIAASPQPESPQAYDVCLPKGGWYDYWSGRKVAAKPGDKADSVRETPRIDRLPVFVRAGAILPRQPLVQSLSETPKGALALSVYPGPDCSGAIYFDDGKAQAIERGAYLRQAFRCAETADGFTVEIGAREGKFKPWWREITVTVHGQTNARTVRIGRKVQAAIDDEAAETLTFILSDTRKATNVTLSAR